MARHGWVSEPYQRARALESLAETEACKASERLNGEIKSAPASGEVKLRP
jgi:hypothetical protein